MTISPAGVPPTLSMLISSGLMPSLALDRSLHCRTAHDDHIGAHDVMLCSYIEHVRA